MDNDNRENGHINDAEALGKKPKLSIRMSSHDSIRQSMPNKRSNTVVVQHKKKRILRGKDSEATLAKSESEAAVQPVFPKIQISRDMSIQEARKRELENKRLREEENRKLEEERKLAEIAKLEEEATKKADDAVSETPILPVIEQDEVIAPKPKKTAVKEEKADADSKASRKGNKSFREESKSAGKKDFSEHRRNKLTIVNALDDEVRERSLSSIRRRKQKNKLQKSDLEQEGRVIREVTIPDFITVKELSNRMAARSSEIIKFLLKQGQVQKVTDVIDGDTAQLIAEEFQHPVNRISESDVEDNILEESEDLGNKVPRPPIVTIMGHVDHGKTTLLDTLRKSRVTEKESGGITQHVGSYQVTANESVITFIDTPGHVAFSKIRARGAEVTDIVILVLAANDGVKQQTIEAIQHIKAFNVPMIVAVNKIDLPEADAQKAYVDLMQHNVYVESMGGEVLHTEISAKTGKNLDKLLDLIELQSELLELKASVTCDAVAVVLEARVENGLGRVLSVVIKQGVLSKGDVFVVGEYWGRVRSLINDKGEVIDKATPSMPVDVVGIQNLPESGEALKVVTNENIARQISEYRQRKKITIASAQKPAITLEQMMSSSKNANKKEMPLIIKADVHGSSEAIIHSLNSIGNDEVKCKILASSVGIVNENDVLLAKSVGGVICAFNVSAKAQIRDLAKNEGVEIRFYSIIYNLIDDVRDALSGLLTPEKREEIIGEAEIQQIFKITAVGKIAGCMVNDGRIERNCFVRLLREGIVIHNGKLGTLKRFADEVKEVNAGQECGMGLAEFQDMRVGDKIECYTITEIKRELAC